MVDKYAEKKKHVLDKLHEGRNSHSEEHQGTGNYIRELVFGFNDGLVSNFALITGIAGAALSSGIIIIAGLAELTAAAISMGVNAFLSSKSQTEFFRTEIERERREIEENPEHEREEIRELYRLKGFRGRLLDQVVRTITGDKDIWLRVMVEEELGMSEEQFKSPARIGVVMFFAAVIGGAVPLASYLLLPVETALPVSWAISLSSLFVLGALKTLVVKRNWLKSGMEMLIAGALAALATYYLGGIIAGLA